MKTLMISAMALLLSTTLAHANLGSRVITIQSSKLVCENSFEILNPHKSIRFLLGSPNDQFDSSVLLGLELHGETACDEETLNQIQIDANGSFGFIPGKISVNELDQDRFEIEVELFVGPEKLKFIGITRKPLEN